VSNKAPNQKLAYSMIEAAEAVGVCYITMHRLVKSGRIKCVPGLRTKIIPRSEIERFLTVREPES